MLCASERSFRTNFFGDSDSGYQYEQSVLQDISEALYLLIWKLAILSFYKYRYQRRVLRKCQVAEKI